MFHKPIVLDGLNCRNISIAGYTLAKGNEVFVSGEDMDLAKLLSLLRARKVFRQTKVLFPTNGVPPFSPDSVWDFEDLKKRLGVTVTKITYREMADEMERLLGDRAEGERAEQAAAELVRHADRTFLDKSLVVRSMIFDRCLRNLMARHGCNAFTIDCFEFCPSLLPQKWLVTPCLQHALFGNEGIASSCEADFGILLALRLLMSVSNKSCHQGNSDPRPGGTFRINHSAPSMKMNGLDQPDLPYQLGRFVQQGWGTKAVINFMNNKEKTVTVAGQPHRHQAARTERDFGRGQRLERRPAGMLGRGRDSATSRPDPPVPAQENGLRKPPPMGLRRLCQRTQDRWRDARPERGPICLIDSPQDQPRSPILLLSVQIL